MKSIFVLREQMNSEMLDPKENIERFKRIRCLITKRTLDSGTAFGRVFASDNRRKLFG